MDSLQSRVEEYLKRNHILKKDFASVIGVTPSQLSRWLKGNMSFDRKTIELISMSIRH